ncbi:MAG: dienelactone hydrolase family protein, partial [Nocardia sp.]|nr:dienelactone hydrolase family protein [Nocardia sp.]
MSPGPHRIMRGDLGIAGQPGVVYAPGDGTNLPAIAFGHGWMTGVAGYHKLFEHLASWGFVVAAPDTERGPLPSHLNLAGDLLTTLDICTGVRLGIGDISVHPDKLALAGHGMGAGAAVLAAARRKVAAVAALYPAPTAPSGEELAPKIDIPALILAGGADVSTNNCNAVDLAAAWGGPVALRTVDKATHNGIAEGRRALAALGAAKYEYKTDRISRALLVGYLNYQLLGDKKYKDFADPEASVPRTEAVDPHAPEDPEAEPVSAITPMQ